MCIKPSIFHTTSTTPYSFHQTSFNPDHIPFCGDNIPLWIQEISFYRYKITFKPQHLPFYHHQFSFNPHHISLYPHLNVSSPMQSTFLLSPKSQPQNQHLHILATAMKVADVAQRSELYKMS
jgi:hypothetical protein